MGSMMAAMRRHSPQAKFVPLVYADNLGYALPNSHALGAPAGVTFIPPASSSAVFPLPSVRREGRYILQFFYKNMLQAWERGDMNPVYVNVARLKVSISGHELLDVDISSGTSVAMFR